MSDKDVILVDICLDAPRPYRICRGYDYIRGLNNYSLQADPGLISRSLSTPEGRTALAQSMTEPIRRALDYQGIGRRLLMVDELPEGAWVRPTRQDVTVLPADDPSRLRLGWTIYEEVGITVLNDYAIARIEIEEENIYETEEHLLYNSLAEIKKDRRERELEKLRNNIPNWSIMWLEIEED